MSVCAIPTHGLEYLIIMFAPEPYRRVRIENCDVPFMYIYIYNIYCSYVGLLLGLLYKKHGALRALLSKDPNSEEDPTVKMF